MIKSIIKIALLLIVGLLVYNYFWGDADEKETSEKVFNEIKDVGLAVKDFVQEEHQRIKDGKYEKVVDKIQEALIGIEAKVKDMDPETIEAYKKLKQETDSIEVEVEKVKSPEMELSDQEKDAIEQRLQDLLNKTNDFIDKHKDE